MILKLYERVDTVFTSENTLQKAWKCARLLSKLSYDNFSFNDVAGSLTNQENRKAYFINTLGYTENEYNSINIGNIWIIHNIQGISQNMHKIDFPHLITLRCGFLIN